jgi:hypothetical protein
MLRLLEPLPGHELDVDQIIARTGIDPNEIVDLDDPLFAPSMFVGNDEIIVVKLTDAGVIAACKLAPAT